MIERYRLTGSAGRLLNETATLADSIGKTLGDEFLVAPAFRFSEPSAANTVSMLAGQGIRNIIALPAYPQCAFSTTMSALEDLRAAAEPFRMKIREIESYPDSPGYILALMSPMAHLSTTPEHVLFCAHGLPMRHVKKGDPYVQHVWRTCEASSKLLPDNVKWSLAYQSKLGPGKWTGPLIGDELERLAGEGVRRLAVVPVSFLCENQETLYDLDIAAAGIARGLGFMRFDRFPAPGNNPALVRQLVCLVKEVL